MELSREQIIKAFERCRTYKVTDCDECPYSNKGGIVDDFYMGCSDKLCEDALALIRELTEENERLRAEVSVKKKLLNRCADLEDTIKVYTVRKIMERVKAEKFYHKNFGDIVYLSDIVQIEKELLEETDEV